MLKQRVQRFINRLVTMSDYRTVRQPSVTMLRMLPKPATLNTTPEFFRELCARTGQSQIWIADNSGISRRRIQYLHAGTRLINGISQPVKLSYPEQFCIECLAEAAERFK